MSNHKGPGPLPNRWLYCPRNGTGIISERFLPFKTPLSARFSSQMPDECQFEPPMVFSYMKMFKLKLGLWIDLTNTTRFYDRRDVESRGAKYHKMQCRGHGETPTAEQTAAFIALVDTFVRQAPLEMIGVHCTHGFNRTGFLIVSYMVERMDCSVEAALMEFARVRPPGIYKADYIRELFRRYDDEEDAPPAPPMPEWCNDLPPEEYAADEGDFNTSNGSAGRPKKRSFNDSFGADAEENETASAAASAASSAASDDDDEDAVIAPSGGGGSSSKSAGSNAANHRQTNGGGGAGAADGAAADGGAPGSVPKKRRKQFLNLNATFMAGVPGVELVTDQPRLGELQEMVQTMCGFEKLGFPGSQPVSMDLENMQLLKKHPYRVSWKADGTRYMMLIKGEDEVYFFDRDNSCFQVQGVRFPRRKNLAEHLVDTLIDGEMVIDNEKGLTVPRYLVYDVVRFDGVVLSGYPFYPTRQQCMRTDVIGPRDEAIRQGLLVKEREPFKLRVKDFWDLTQSKALLAPKFAKMLLHEPDGLIFQPSVLPYVSGPCKEVLKWKPAEMNSVDFKLKIAEESGLGIIRRRVAHLYVGQHDPPFSQMKCTRALRELNGKIIECKFENNQWVFMRERTDKSFPNSYNTALAVCRSIKYPVTTEILLSYIDKHRYRSDVHIMPPPQAPAQQHSSSHNANHSSSHHNAPPNSSHSGGGGGGGGAGVGAGR